MTHILMTTRSNKLSLIIHILFTVIIAPSLRIPSLLLSEYRGDNFCYYSILLYKSHLLNQKMIHLFFPAIISSTRPLSNRNNISPLRSRNCTTTCETKEDPLHLTKKSFALIFIFKNVKKIFA